MQNPARANPKMTIDRAADQIIAPQVAFSPADEDMSAFSAEVRATAYLLWKEAGCRSGEEDECWYKALDQHIRKRVTADRLMQESQRRQ